MPRLERAGTDALQTWTVGRLEGCRGGEERKGEWTGGKLEGFWWRGSMMGGRIYTYLPWTPRWQRSRASFPERDEPSYSATPKHLPYDVLPAPPPPPPPREEHLLTVWKHMSTTKELKSCWVLGNAQRVCTMSCFVCFIIWTRRSVGKGKKAKVMSVMPWTLWLAPLPPFLAQSSHHTLTGVLECLHIPVVQEVRIHAVSRRHRGTVGGGLASTGVSRSWPASAGEPHGLGEESRLWYSQGWVLELEWNGQGEAGLLMISTQESLAVPRVMDQVIPEREQWRQYICVVWSFGGLPCPSPPLAQILRSTYCCRNCRIWLFNSSDPKKLP